MLVVIDASVAVQASLSEGGFVPLDGHDLRAPALMWSEATSALHELGWRGAVDVTTTARALAVLLDAPVLAGDPQHVEAWDIAGALGWAKTYDAEYVALAQALDCPLLTIDRRLARGASRLVRTLGPTEL